MAGVDRSRSVLTALALAATAAECRQMDDVRNHLLPALAQAVGGHVAVYHQMSMTPDVQEFGVHWPDDPAVPAALSNYPAVVAYSPLLQHFAQTNQPGVVCISQLATRRQWHANPVYRDSHRFLDVDDQLALMFAGPQGEAHGITIARSGKDFEPSDAYTVTLVAPHLRAALRRCLESGIPYRAMKVIPAPVTVWSTGPALVPAPAGPSLTSREHEVLALAGAGMASTTIARRLDISPRTVDKHLENAYRKLGVACRFEAATKLHQGTRVGLYPPSAPLV